MHRLSFILLAPIATACLIFSCKKNNTADNSAAIKHKWQVTSINGEALRYVGQPADYFDFGNTDTLIEFVGGRYDTLYYQLHSDGHTLDIHSFNGMVAYPGLAVKTLTNTQLIITGGRLNPPINIVDSLRR